jgi:serine/threonine-protein kinase
VTRIGRYEVEAELGRGSMGIVHLAHDPVVCRQVAVKTISLPAGLPDEKQREFEQRFLREARAAGRLSHPGIVTIYDVDESPDSGKPFIAMEYVPGRTLQHVLRNETPLDPHRALEIADTLADALGTAHAAGVVHRDVKPANILVRASDGAVKVADFGIARLHASELTQDDSTIGSPAYMSPEQIRCDTADARSDLFSLAVILYEALSGQRPFHGDDAAAIVYSVVHGDAVPITRHRPFLPGSFDDFFARALAKAPEDRFQDAGSMRDALSAIGREVETPAVSTGSSAIVARSVESAAELPSDTHPRGGELAGPSSGTPDWRIHAAAGALLFLFVIAWSYQAGRDGSLPSSASDDPGPPRAEASLSRPPDEPLEPPLVAGDDAAKATAARESSPEPAAVPEVAPSPAPVSAPVASAAPPADVEERRPATVGSDPAQRPDDTPTEPAVDNLLAESAPPPALEVDDPAAAAGESMAASPEAVLGPGFLQLNLRNSVKDGTLVLLVDGESVYQRSLTSDDRGFHRIVKRATGRLAEGAESRLAIEPGRHLLVARMEIVGKSRIYEDRVEVEITPGQTLDIDLTTGRTLGRRLTLEVR